LGLVEPDRGGLVLLLRLLLLRVGLLRAGLLPAVLGSVGLGRRHR